MQELYALVQGKIAPQAVSLEQLIELAKQYPDPQSSEYQMIDLASNILLAYYFNQAQAYL